MDVRRADHGVVAMIALLSDTSWTAPASLTAHCNQNDMADGRPGGQRSISTSEPSADVRSGTTASAGVATSSPPLNGTGIEDVETSSRHAAEGLAFLSASVATVSPTSVP